MHRLNNLFLGLFFLILCISCNDDNSMDTMDPQVLEGNIIPSPTAGIVCGITEPDVIYARSGDSIRIGLTFRDNEELSQYKIDLYENFNCQSQRSNTSTWDMTKITDLSGTEETVQEILAVPSNVTAGNYQCVLVLLDAAGNTSTPKYYLLSILNSTDTLAPSLSASTPSTNSLTMSTGDSLNLQGILSDNNILEGGRLDLLYAGSDGVKINALTQNLDSTITSNSYNYNIDYIIPNTLSGSFNFELRAFDAVGNASNTQQFSIQVL